MGFLKFLGTGGARVVVSRQVRASGGMWLELAGVNLLIDPGPGALVRCTSSKPALDPSRLDAVILTHLHLDHSADVNVMVEAMTEGGSKKRGVLFAPRDALEGENAVVLKYLRRFPEKIEVLKEGGRYQVGPLSFSTPLRHDHPVETYGLNVSGEGLSLSFISDTRYFEGLSGHYRGEVLVLNVVRLKPDAQDLAHLNLEDAKRLIEAIQPKISILTHFGMTMVRAKPWELAEALTQELGLKVLAARDGMKVELPQALKG